MQLTWLLSLPAVLSVVSAMAIERRDADFFSVRTTLHKDMSGRGGDPKEKYFRKSFPIPLCCWSYGLVLVFVLGDTNCVACTDLFTISLSVLLSLLLILLGTPFANIRCLPR